MKDFKPTGYGWWELYRMGGIKTAVTAMFDPQNAQHTAFIRSLMKDQRKNHPEETMLSQMEVVVFDLETTGFSPYAGDEILSIGAVSMTGKEVAEPETFHSYVNPKRMIPKHIQELTAITDEIAAASPDLIEVLKQFYAYDRGRTLIAHGSGHDKRFLDSALWKTSKVNLTHRLLDTMMIAKWLHPKCEDYGLDALLERYQIPISKRHHALEDSRMTARLWGRLVDEMETRGVLTLGDLYAHLSHS